MTALMPKLIPLSCRNAVRTALLLLCVCLALPAWSAFSVNAGNGTVTDTTTSLVWDQCPYGLTGANCTSGTALLATWPQALSAAVSANAANYRGFNDWRVPNKNELESIVKLDTYTAGQAAIDSTAFPNTPIGGDTWGWGGTWTSTSYTPNPSVGWFVGFYDGDVSGNLKSGTGYVRLVRSGQSLASFDSLPATYAITATASPPAGGTVSCSPNPVSHGSNTSCTATANAGYSFSAFSGDCTGASCALNNVTATKSVTASFTLSSSYSAPAPGGGGTVNASLAGAATCGFASVGYQTAASTGSVPPAGYTFVHGVFTFTTNTNCATGVTITLTYPSALPAGTRFFKYGPATAEASPTWYEHPATISGNTITYSVADNGQGDNNPAVGVIGDPAGAGVPADVTAVPTLSEWAMILLAAMIAALGMAFMRKRV